MKLEYLAHPHYCSQNNCEGGGTHVGKIDGCECIFAVTKGGTNVELQQQPLKEYSCEKSEEHMMGKVNDNEMKWSFDEETRRLMK
jgi:hypothetical protein